VTNISFTLKSSAYVAAEHSYNTAEGNMDSVHSNRSHNRQ